MSDPLDGPLVVDETEASVLLHAAPSEGRPDVDPTARLRSDNYVTVSVRFDRPPAADALPGEAVLVGPVDPEEYPTRVYQVDGVDDLTGYGVALTRVFEAHESPLLVTVDSVTTLLQHVSVDEAFRFVHVLASRVERERALLVAHIDPDAHDDRTVARLTQVFEVVVSNADGDRTVRRRA